MSSPTGPGAPPEQAVPTEAASPDRVPSGTTTPPAPPLPPELPAGWNGFAIASLVTGIVAPLGGGLLSIIFGIVALVQIRRRRQRGKGLAIAGLAITAAYLAAIAVLITVSLLNSSPMRNDNGEIIRSGSVEADSLRVGDCLEDLDGTGIDLPGLPCAEPHLAEVYAVFDMDGDWPGEHTVTARAGESCADHLAIASLDAFEDRAVEVYYFSPTRASWLLGDREVVCVAYFLDGERTGSIFDG
jgi:hypothetical protein